METKIAFDLCRLRIAGRKHSVNISKMNQVFLETHRFHVEWKFHET